MSDISFVFCVCRIQYPVLCADVFVLILANAVQIYTIASTSYTILSSTIDYAIDWIKKKKKNSIGDLWNLSYSSTVSYGIYSQKSLNA